MTFNYVNVQVNRSETTVVPLCIPPWEVAVVMAVNGDDRVVVIGGRPVRRELPDAASEYDRLALKYKRDMESGQDFIAMVYGVGARGVKNLAAEIEKARNAPLAQPTGAAFTGAEDPTAGLFDDQPPATGDEGVVAITE